MAHVVELRRAAYGWGKDKVPLEEREYTLVGDSSGRVGCLDEYNHYFAEQGFERLTYKLRDKGGLTWVRDIELKRVEGSE